MSRPLPLRLGGRSVEAAITLRGSSVTLEREGRRLDAAVRRDGAVIEVESGGRVSRCVATRGPRNVWVVLNGRTYVLEIEHREEGAARGGDAADEIRAPMTGRVVAVATAVGAAPREGDLLLTIEAMKMEFKLTAPENGTVLEVACAEGDRVELGQLLVRLRPDEADGAGGGAAPERSPAPEAGPR
ncbi:MAG TPA: biotin/lipoyl-containing protein [Candidatus Eisenbacteria bacterium]